MKCQKNFRNFLCFTTTEQNTNDNLVPLWPDGNQYRAEKHKIVSF